MNRFGPCHHLFFFFLKSLRGSMCNADHTGRNADNLRTETVPLSLLYKPLQWLVHFSSFQFPSQHLTNLTFFVHGEIGLHRKFWMQTIEEGKAWMQLCHLPHKPFIFWWNLVPVTDLSISCTNIAQHTKDHPTNKPNDLYLPPDTLRQQGVCVSFLLLWLLWGLTQSPQSGNRTTRFN